MQVESIDLLETWANHAAIPFQGQSRSDVSEKLVLAIGTAIKTASRVIGDLDEVKIGYRWDDRNNIIVERDPERFTSDMLIVKGKEWAEQ